MTLNELNTKYNDETYPLFPFISKTKITLLPAGLYRKHKASFRGITAVFDKESSEYVFPLYGMYHIKENLVIVPDEMEMNSNKQTFLDATIKSGFKKTNKAPKFETYFFEPDSEEAKLALANKLEYQSSKKTA